jgi:hypothetical protein
MIFQLYHEFRSKLIDAGAVWSRLHMFLLNSPVFPPLFCYHNRYCCHLFTFRPKDRWAKKEQKHPRERLVSPAENEYISGKQILACETKGEISWKFCPLQGPVPRGLRISFCLRMGIYKGYTKRTLVLL